MKILSVETATSTCSVAILEDNQIIYEESKNNGFTHSQNLLPMIKEAFDQTHLTLSQIDLFTASVGPGSFTGIRIGIASLKAFVDVFKKPSIGISSLEGLCYTLESSGLTCSILDAKNENVYFALYDGNQVIISPCFSSVTDMIKMLESYQEKEITFIGDACFLYKKELTHLFPHAKFAKKNTPKASSIGKAAFYHFQNGESQNYSLSPLYLRKSQAERALEKKEEGKKNDNH